MLVLTNITLMARGAGERGGDLIRISSTRGDSAAGGGGMRKKLNFEETLDWNLSLRFEWGGGGGGSQREPEDDTPVCVVWRDNDGFTGR